MKKVLENRVLELARKIKVDIKEGIIPADTINELSEIWHNNFEFVSDLLDDNYPFDTSFDELVFGDEIMKFNINLDKLEKWAVKKKTFKIPVSWSMMALQEVEATTLEEAIEIFDKNIDTYDLTEGNYIDGSYQREHQDGMSDEEYYELYVK